MAYYRKNKRRFDPRYFMNERLEEEGLEEMHVGDGRFKRKPTDDDTEFHPETIRQGLDRAFAQKDEEDVEDQLANLAWAEDEELERQRIANLEEGCGDDEELPWIKIEGGELTASDSSEKSLADIIATGEAWKKIGIKIIGGRADVLDALEIEAPASDPLPSLMDEEPPLEE